MKRYIGDRNFYRRVSLILIPILLQNVITNFVSLLDNIMVGQIGTEPMSGVAIVNQLLFVYNVCVFGGLSGAGILTAQFCGKGDHEGVRQTVRIKLILGLGIFAVFTVVLETFSDTFIGLFLHEGESDLDLNATLRYAQEYMDVMMLQMLPFVITTMYSSTLRETGETVVPMRAGIIAVFVNLVFNYIFIFGKLGVPALGVVGAAIATVLSRVVEMCIVVIWTHRHREKNPFIVGLYQSLRVSGDVLKRTALLGLPLMINELLWSGGMTVLNQCYSLRGLEVVSAMNIYSTISNVFFSAFIATGNATAIIVGQLLGAGELKRAVDEDRKLIAFAVALSVVISALMVLTAPLFPRIYNTIPEVKHLATRILVIGALTMPMHAFANSCYFTLRSGGKTFITFVFDSGSLWVINIPAAVFIGYYTDLPIIPFFAIVEGLIFIKCIIGAVMVRQQHWVVNLTEGTKV